MTHEENKLYQELRIAYTMADDLMNSQVGLNINDLGYLGYTDLMAAWGKILDLQNELITKLDNLKTQNNDHVLLLYVKNDLVIVVREANISHSYTLDELLDYMGLDLKQIENILGFEPDYDCLICVAYGDNYYSKIMNEDFYIDDIPW